MIEKKIYKDKIIIECIEKKMANNKTIKSSKKKSIQLNMDDDNKYIMEQFPLIGRTKFPSTAYKKHKSGDLKGQYITKEKWITDIHKVRDCNYGTTTGKQAGFWVLDIDMYCKEKKRYMKKEEHPFFKAFPDFEYDTLTIKSANKGFHFYYQWDDAIPMASHTGEEVRTDTRGNGGYIVSPYSCIKTYDGDMKYYKPINSLPINKCSDKVMDWLKTNVMKTKNTKATPKKPNKIKMDKIEKDEEEYDMLDLTKYNFDITEDELLKIVEGLPNKYFTNYNDWLIFTTGMKTLWDAKEGSLEDKAYIVDIWDDISQSNSEEHYDYDKNNEIWDGITAHKYMKCVFKLFIDTEYKSAYQLLHNSTYKPVLKNRIVPDYEIDRKKLGYDFFEEFQFGELRDCIIAKSDTGTGKTTSTKHFLEGKKFISLVSRVSLGEEQYTIFNEHGLECVFYEYINEYEGENIVIQIDSIGMLSQGLYKYGAFSEYYVYIDEFNSLVEYLCRSPTLNKYRIRVFDMLIDLISECKGVIGTDADISDISLKLLQYTTKTPIFIKNNHKHNSGVKSEEIINYDEFMSKITQEEEFLCCCDSKTQAEIIYNKCKQAGMNDTILITSITNNYCRFDDHKRIIYSPKIIYGIDSVMERPVYCFYKEHTISPNAMVQQVARCRKIKTLYYHFEKKQMNEYSFDNVDEAKEYLLSVDKEIKALKYQKSSEEAFERFLELYSRFLYNEDAHNTNKYAHFISIARERGIIMNPKLEKEDKKRRNFRADKKENKKIQIKNFDPTTTSAQKLNEVLQLPDETTMKKYAELFIEPWKAEYHFNLIDYLYKANEEVTFDIEELDDYSLEKIKHRSFKLDLFNSLREKVFADNSDKKRLEMNPPNKKGIRGNDDKELPKKTLIKIYHLWNMATNNCAGYVKEKKEEAFNETTQDIINLIANGLFPEELFDVKRRNVKKLDENGNVMRGKPDEKNKKGKILYDKEAYTEMNDEKLKKHLELAWYRQNHSEQTHPDIEDYDKDVRDIINELDFIDDKTYSSLPDYCLIDI